MQRSFSSAVIFTMAILVTGLFAGCGGGGGTSSGGGGASSTFVPGKWTFSIFSNSGLFGPTAELDMDLDQSGGTISSSNLESVDSVSCGGMHLDSSTGTVSGDKIHLVFSIDSEKITFDATLAPGGTAVGEASLGNWSAEDGPCLGGQHGIFTASLIPALTGTWTGILGLANVNTMPSVTVMLAEDANFSVSGSMAVTDDPCFSSIAIAPDNLGLSVGSLSSFEMTDGTNVLDFIGSIEGVPPIPLQFDANVTVVSGCTEESGTLNITMGDPPAAMDSSGARNAKAGKQKINPLLVERMKNLIAARRAQLMK
jgi:hypothetical protein